MASKRTSNSLTPAQIRGLKAQQSAALSVAQNKSTPKPKSEPKVPQKAPQKSVERASTPSVKKVTYNKPPVHSSSTSSRSVSNGPTAAEKVALQAQVKARQKELNNAKPPNVAPNVSKSATSPKQNIAVQKPPTSAQKIGQQARVEAKQRELNNAKPPNVAPNVSKFATSPKQNIAVQKPPTLAQKIGQQARVEARQKELNNPPPKTTMSNVSKVVPKPSSTLTSVTYNSKGIVNSSIMTETEKYQLTAMKNAILAEKNAPKSAPMTYNNKGQSVQPPVTPVQKQMYEARNESRRLDIHEKEAEAQRIKGLQAQYDEKVKALEDNVPLPLKLYRTDQKAVMNVFINSITDNINSIRTIPETIENLGYVATHPIETLSAVSNSLVNKVNNDIINGDINSWVKIRGEIKGELALSLLTKGSHKITTINSIVKTLKSVEKASDVIEHIGDISRGTSKLNETKELVTHVKNASKVVDTTKEIVEEVPTLSKISNGVVEGTEKAIKGGIETGQKLLNVGTKGDAIAAVKNLPEAIQSKVKDFYRGGSNAYNNFGVEKLENGNYLVQMTKPSNVPGSYATYFKEITETGETVITYKNTIDPLGNLVHTKIK